MKSRKAKYEVTRQPLHFPLTFYFLLSTFYFLLAPHRSRVSLRCSWSHCGLILPRSFARTGQWRYAQNVNATAATEIPINSVIARACVHAYRLRPPHPSSSEVLPRATALAPDTAACVFGSSGIEPGRHCVQTLLSAPFGILAREFRRGAVSLLATLEKVAERHDDPHWRDGRCRFIGLDGLTRHGRADIAVLLKSGCWARNGRLHERPSFVVA